MLMPIPRQIFEHFRAPRNKRSMPDATAKGVVESGRDGQTVTLYLRLGPDGRVADASFTNTGDRSSDASLSILTTLLPRRSVAELETIGVRDIARALGALDMPGVAAPAHDVLVATLAALRGEPNPFAEEGRLICTCFHVREERIRRAIRAHDLRTVEDVTHWTRACGGCRSCRPEVHLIIAQERDRRPPEAGAGA